MKLQKRAWKSGEPVEQGSGAGGRDAGRSFVCAVAWAVRRCRPVVLSQSKSREQIRIVDLFNRIGFDMRVIFNVWGVRGARVPACKIFGFMRRTVLIPSPE